VSEKTVFWNHLYLKTNILPRQARDKHRENFKTDAFSLRDGAQGQFAEAASPQAKRSYQYGYDKTDRSSWRYVKTRLFARPFCTKNTSFLPRQARDKHRESTQKEDALSYSFDNAEVMRRREGLATNPKTRRPDAKTDADPAGLVYSPQLQVVDDIMEENGAGNATFRAIYI
jgi:hypothetical protein